MPHYYFDLFDGNAVIRDEFGDTFTHSRDAVDLASGLLVDIAREVINQKGGKDLGVAVRDEAGHDVYWAALMFRDSHADPKGPPCARNAAPTLTIANPVALIQQSREIRAAATADLPRSLHAVIDTVEDATGIGEPLLAAAKGASIPG